MITKRLSQLSRMRDFNARGWRFELRKMAPCTPPQKRHTFAVAAVTGLLLVMTPALRAASVEFEPAALAKQRTALCLKAGGTPLADLESDINHLAVLSETCRAEYGAKACGLAEKALDSEKLEERYAYYIRRPVDARFSGHQMKIDRHKWETPDGSASH